MTWDDLCWQLGKLGRLRFGYQLRRKQGVFEVFVGLNTAFAIGILGLVARWTSWPLIFPSLGPSLFLIFYAPQRPMSASRNTFMAHVLGGVLGFSCYKLFLALGLLKPNVFDFGHVLSGALTLGLAGFLMVRFGVLHPPAASTTLIASLGYLPHWYHLGVLAVSLIILFVQAHLFHGLAGVYYPWWNPLKEEAPEISTTLGTISTKLKQPEDLKTLSEMLVTRGASAIGEKRRG